MPNRIPQTALLLLSVFTCAGGQTPAVEMPPTCNEEFARFLVDQQVSESRNVEQTDKRIRILIRAAEFIWKYDEPTAREYFAEAYKFATDRFKEKGFEKIENNRITTQLPDYRFEVVKAIAARDAEWAKKLIEQLLQEYDKEAADRKGFDKNRELEDIIRIAQESVKYNPELSRFLLRRIMTYPLDYYWFFLPYSIAEHNRRLADAIYIELLANYANAPPRRFLFLSAYPFASGQILGPNRFGYGISVPASLTPNRDLQRRFIDAFLRRAVSYANDPANLNSPGEQYWLPEPAYLISGILELEPLVVQQFPEFIQRLSEAKAMGNGMLTEQMRRDLSDQERRNEISGYSFEQRLKRVDEAEADGKLTDQLIVSLLISGEMNKTEEQFKLIEPWLDKIKEDGTRYDTINYFWFLRAQLAVKEYRMADAERFARKIPEVEHRAILFFEIAEAQLKNPSDLATALQTLREVGRLAEQSETSVEKARVLLALANQYLKINQIFAMQELSDAIKVINRLEKADVMSTSVRRQIVGKNFSFFSGFALPGYNLEGTFKAISKDNFEMSLSNAKALEDKYLRTLAVIAVAQNCVDKVKKKAPARRTNTRRGN